jgi:Undecaprenyl-phosphate galactose phosphotransferase WbaP
LLQLNLPCGLRPLGILSEPYELWLDDGDAANYEYLGPLGELRQIVARRRVYCGVVATDAFDDEQLGHVIAHCLTALPRLVLLSNDDAVPTLWARRQEYFERPATVVKEPLLLLAPRLFKCASDIALLVVAGLLSIPLFLVIGLAIKVASPGPVFFCQPRIGRFGKVFSMWKFRTMVPRAEQVLEVYLNADPELRREWEQTHKLRHDPRIIPYIGAWLRRTSLDELPQIWNVLRGEMSFIGPRPIVAGSEGRPYRLEFPTNFWHYQKVRPGIPGLWQVSGRNQTTYERRVQLDSYYVRNWSPWLDLYILLRTARAVIGGAGAY